MKFSDWSSKKDKNPIVETLFKIITTTGFLEEKINKKQVLEFWQGFPSDSEVELEDPFGGDEDAEPIDTTEKISNIEKRLNREKRIEDEEASRKKEIKRNKIKEKQERKKAMEMWRKEKSSNSEESPEILLKKAKDALLAFRWKGMYERKKRIEELKKLSVNQQNLRRIFDLLVELEYLRPPGVKGGPPRGDDFEQIKPERLTKAIENAKSETDNDYPEYMEQMLADPQCDLDCFKRNAKIALRKVFVKNAYDSSGLIPYGEYADAAIRKFIRYAGKRRVTSHVQVKSHKGKDVRSLYELKAKPWNWPWLTNSEKIDDPQEIKKAIQQRLGRASDSLKSDDQYRRKEKTIGLGVGEVGDFDPIKLVGSREKSPQMSIVDIDRSEKLEMIRSSVQDAFFDLYKHNSNMFFVFATTLGLEYSICHSCSAIASRELVKAPVKCDLKIVGK